MRTVRDIIRALGGNTAVGRILDKGPSTVSEMARRGSIGIEYWPALIAAAKSRDLAAKDGREVFLLTNDMLVAAHLPTEAPAEAVTAEQVA